MYYFDKKTLLIDNTQSFMNQTIKMVFSMGNFFKTGDFKSALRIAKVCTKYVNIPNIYFVSCFHNVIAY